MKKIEKFISDMSNRSADRVIWLLSGIVIGLIIGYFVYAWIFWEFIYRK